MANIIHRYVDIFNRNVYLLIGIIKPITATCNLRRLVYSVSLLLIMLHYPPLLCSGVFQMSSCLCMNLEIELTRGSIGPGTLCQQIKRPDRDSDHSPLSSAGVRNGEAILQLPHGSSWRDA